LGGALVIGLVYLFGTRDYLGLGVGSPDPAASDDPLELPPPEAPGISAGCCKLVFTVATLAAGFKGGEVTPCSSSEPTLGNVLARLYGRPRRALRGPGFVAVFAGSTTHASGLHRHGDRTLRPTHVVSYAIAAISPISSAGILDLQNRSGSAFRKRASPQKT
jgi:H+/Cl- antiporter ClcA